MTHWRAFYALCVLLFKNVCSPWLLLARLNTCAFAGGLLFCFGARPCGLSSANALEKLSTAANNVFIYMLELEKKNTLHDLPRDQALHVYLNATIPDRLATRTGCHLSTRR